MASTKVSSQFRGGGSERESEDNEDRSPELAANTSFEETGLMRRSQFEIRMDMLRAVKDGAEGPTQIMYKANLSWITLQQHLRTLVTNGCLKWVENGNRKKYELTSKGLTIMTSYVNLITEVGGQGEPRLETRAAMLKARLY